MAALDVRIAAVNVMLQMQSDGGSLTRLLPEAQSQVAEKDRALLQVFCFGMSRWSRRLSGIVDTLLTKPLKRKDTDVYLLLQLGIFQLSHTRVAPHAAVDTTVAAVKHLKKPWAKGLVNAVLRNYQRREDELVSMLDEPAALSHPPWLLARYKKDWPLRWQEIVEQGNLQAPMTLRVNQKQLTTDAYLEKLKDADIDGVRVDAVPSAITLESPVSVQSLPGFEQGWVSVQDAAAQKCAMRLGDGAGKRLLDACSAPGGKTAQAMEQGNWRQVVALDQDPGRLARVDETLQRLNFTSNYELHCADASNLDTWWDSTLFDSVLLDAPCSGTGVIRRHPDIKLLRRDNDIEKLVAMQRRLLTNLWQTLAPGGHLLYATCSILKDENEHQIDWFLQQRSDAKAGQLEQILPGEQGMDGFFFASLVKS